MTSPGRDAAASAVLDELAAAGVRVEVGHAGRLGADADVVLWSPAVPEGDPELAAARARGAALVTRAELLADLAQRARGRGPDRDPRQDDGDLDDGPRDGRGRARRRRAWSARR